MTHPTSKGEVAPQDESALKFGACAVIDLQGFSSHLELSGYDLRTAIGQQAVERLQTLEDGINAILDERIRRADSYPDVHLRRINDSIVVAMDLDDILIPSVGSVSFGGLPPDAFAAFFSEDEMKDESTFRDAYNNRMRVATEPLELFVGLVARLHLYVQARESGGFFPGAKTIISSGLRRRFVSSNGQEDMLSANFALANAAMADKALRGPFLFVDNILLEIISGNPHAQHLVQFASFDWRAASFDPLTSTGGENAPPPHPVVHAPIDVDLFRRRYVYRKLSAQPLTYLQHLKSVRPFLRGERVPNRQNVYYAHVLDAIRYGIGMRRIAAAAPPPSFVNASGNDLDVDVAEFAEFLTVGESPTKNARLKRKARAKLGLADLNPDSPLAKELDALDEEEVSLELPTALDIEELGHVVWSLSEAALSGLTLLMSGDWSRLEFAKEE